MRRAGIMAAHTLLAAGEPLPRGLPEGLPQVKLARASVRVRVRVRVTFRVSVRFGVRFRVRFRVNASPRTHAQYARVILRGYSTCKYDKGGSLSLASRLINQQNEDCIPQQCPPTWCTAKLRILDPCGRCCCKALVMPWAQRYGTGMVQAWYRHGTGLGDALGTEVSVRGRCRVRVKNGMQGEKTVANTYPNSSLKVNLNLNLNLNRYYHYQ